MQVNEITTEQLQQIYKMSSYWVSDVSSQHCCYVACTLHNDP